MSENPEVDLQLTEEQLGAIAGAGGCPTCNCPNCWGDRLIREFVQKRAGNLISHAESAFQSGKFKDAQNIIDGPQGVKRHLDMVEDITNRLAKRHKTS